MSNEPRTLLLSVISYGHDHTTADPSHSVSKEFDRVDDCILYLDKLDPDAPVSIVMSATRAVAQSALSYAHLR
ncbi:hypothetical protein LCGC14_1019310 [marine sediment metagenome]|uniref:Uncharacterized protein n=1 Tax=marine sediment metagenome TaxID=412755 RepID=A0A0F9QG28_9ZZZZ